MKKVLSLVAAAMLMLGVAYANEAQPQPEAPVFTVDSGIYRNDIVLQIYGDGDIYYTTDGSVPTTSSNRYRGPLGVSTRSEEIVINNGFRRPRPDALQAEQEPPEKLTLPSASTIRAAVIKNGVSSEVVSRTYFVGEDVAKAFGNIPIVNIVMAPYDLWDSNNGIYSNYNYEHKVPAEVHYISTDGKNEFSRRVDIKVSGHGSRSAPKKSLRIYFDKKDPLHYDLIPQTDKNYLNNEAVTEFSKVTFRISDWSNTNLRDVLAQKIGESTRADTANSTPVALLLNGQYWGMYECREQYDEKYVAAHYDIAKDSIVFMDRDWTLPPQKTVLPETGKTYTDKLEYASGPLDGAVALGESYYREQWSYVKSLAMEKDISDPKVYDEFCANVDIDNFIDFVSVYIFAGNDDWPGNNVKFWRVTEEAVDPDKYGADGKWRFMIHDFDIAFERSDHQTLFLSSQYKGDDGDARHPEFATALLGGLLKNESFRSELAQRMAVYLSTYMSREEIDRIVASLAEQRSDAKLPDLARWGYFGSLEMRLNWWKMGLENYGWYAEDRADVLKKQYTEVLNKYYNAGISGEAKLKISADCSFSIGGVMSGEKLQAKELAVFAGIPITIKAEGADISVDDGKNKLTAAKSLTFIPKVGDYTVRVVKSETVVADEASSAVGLMRPERFAVMKVGESIPAIVFDNNSGREQARLSVEGECAVIENGYVRALKSGEAVLYAETDGEMYTAKIVVR